CATNLGALSRAPGLLPFPSSPPHAVPYAPERSDGWARHPASCYAVSSTLCQAGTGTALRSTPLPASRPAAPTADNRICQLGRIVTDGIVGIDDVGRDYLDAPG